MSELRSLLAGNADFYSPGDVDAIPTEKGTYMLILNVRKPVKAKTAHGFTIVKPGVYAYVGSAFGPGGLRARIHRHLKKEKRIHWHIDWLTTSKTVEKIGVFVISGRRIESEIARMLATRFPAVPGFGASDSPEDSHLFMISKGI